MKRSLFIVPLQLLAFVVLLPELIFAQSSASIVYVGEGTTLNGDAVYSTAALKQGDRVETSTESAELNWQGADVKLMPNSSVVLGNSVTLNCGSLQVISGTLTATIHGVVQSRGEHQSFDAGLCNSALPDTPSATQSASTLEEAPPLPGSLAHRRQHRAGAPAPAAGALLRADSNIATRPYWILTGAMFASSVVNAEYASRCVQQKGNCTSIPEALRSRPALYGIGLPTEVGISYLTYYLKARGHRWWFVPAAALTVGNTFVAAHWAHRLR